MIRFFSANHFYNFILILFLGALIFLSGLVKPVDDLFLANCLRPSPFSLFFNNVTLPATIGLGINFVLVMTICFQLLRINTKFAFVKERTFLPSYFFLFITLALPDMRVIHPIYIAAIFILLATNKIFQSFEQPKAISNAFEAAFLTGVASLFYLHALFFIFLIPLSLYSLRLKTIWNEWVAAFIGGMLPWFFAFPPLLILKKTEFLRYLLQQFIFFDQGHFTENPYLIAFFSFYLLIIFSASIFILRQYHTQKISSRRYYKILFYFFILSIILILFPPVSYEIVVLAAIPVSYLFTNYFITAKRRRLSNFVFGMMMVIAFALQFVV